MDERKYERCKVTFDFIEQKKVVIGQIIRAPFEQCQIGYQQNLGEIHKNDFTQIFLEKNKKLR